LLSYDILEMSRCTTKVEKSVYYKTKYQDHKIHEFKDFIIHAVLDRRMQRVGSTHLRDIASRQHSYLRRWSSDESFAMLCRIWPAWNSNSRPCFHFYYEFFSFSSKLRKVGSLLVI